MIKKIFLIIIGMLGLTIIFIIGMRFFQGYKMKKENPMAFHCVKEGNMWISNYPERAPFCLKEYSDAGKGCISSSECKGGCVVEKVGELGKTGHCKKNSLPPSGCFAYVEDNFLDYYAGDMRFRCSGEDVDNYSQQVCKECF